MFNCTAMAGLDAPPPKKLPFPLVDPGFWFLGTCRVHTPNGRHRAIASTALAASIASRGNKITDILNLF